MLIKGLLRPESSSLCDPSIPLEADHTVQQRMTKQLVKPIGALRLALIVCALCLIASMAAGALSGCSSSDGAGGTSPSGVQSGASDEGTTSGPAYAEPSTVALSAFNAQAATAVGPGFIDASNVSLGYVGASVTSNSRCKFQVISGDMSYNYDIPSDGTPIIAPINMGSGSYTFRLMQNTSGSNYAELGSLPVSVQLESEFAPFLRPNIFCEYNETSACVTKAFELAANAQNQGDVVRDIYEWVVRSIDYDTNKASQLASTTGYIPNPDETLSSGYGICFDYASLAAAMFRSLGIPCQIVTGYVQPDDLYHAWNMIYIDGSWVSAMITVDADDWTRIDLTFAASNGTNVSYIGSGTSYTDRYIY